jgi:N-acetylglucosamine malate deacetylase 1
MFNRIRDVILVLLKRIPMHQNYLFVLKNLKPLLELKHVNSLLETKRFFRLIETIELKAPKGKNITVIAPHTDDDIFGAGGTLLKASKLGADVSIIYISNSAKTPAQALLVKQEAKDICGCYGAKPYFLDMTPGNIYNYDHKIINSLRELLISLSPDTLFISFFLDDNDDHRRANQLLMDSIDGVDFEQVEVWAYQIYSTLVGNVIVDITDSIDTKISLMNMWKNVEGKRNWVHYILGINMMNCRYLKKTGKKYGELFFVIPSKEYFKLCKEYFSKAL